MVIFAGWGKGLGGIFIKHRCVLLVVFGDHVLECFLILFLVVSDGHFRCLRGASGTGVLTSSGFDFGFGGFKGAPFLVHGELAVEVATGEVDGGFMPINGRIVAAQPVVSEKKVVFSYVTDIES